MGHGHPALLPTDPPDHASTLNPPPQHTSSIEGMLQCDPIEIRDTATEEGVESVEKRRMEEIRAYEDFLVEESNLAEGVGGQDAYLFRDLGMHPQALDHSDLLSHQNFSNFDQPGSENIQQKSMEKIEERASEEDKCTSFKRRRRGRVSTGE